MSNDFDRAARFAAKMEPDGFLQWLFLAVPVKLEFQVWMDTRTLPFPGEADRTCDTVAELQVSSDPRRRWAIVIEFQSEPETAMLGRLLDYQGRLYNERKGNHLVAAALVNLTGPALPDTLDMRLPGAEGFGLWSRVVLKTMREEDAAATLAGIAEKKLARCVLPWIPLMRGAEESSIIREWKRLARMETNSRLRSQYAVLALVFAELANRLNQWKGELEGWNMRESQVVSEWRAEGRKQGQAEGRKQGQVEGRKQGQVEGREQGRAEGQQTALLQFLKKRFNDGMPKNVTNVIKRESNLEILARWIEQAAIAESLEDFLRVIQR